MYGKLPKLFRDNELYEFLTILEQTPNIDSESLKASIYKLEKHYHITLSNENATDFTHYLEFIKATMDARYSSRQSLSIGGHSQVNYLIRLLCSRYNIPDDSLDENHPVAKYVYLKELLYCLNVEETDMLYHSKIIDLATDPTISEYIQNSPDTLAAIYFSKAMTGDIEEAATFFGVFKNMPLHGIGCYIYSFLFHVSIGENEKGFNDLTEIKEKDVKSTEQSTIQPLDNIASAFRLGLIHKILTPESQKRWLTLIEQSNKEG